MKYYTTNLISLAFLCCGLILISIFSSCNITNHLIKKTNRHYEKLGAIEWIYETDSAAIFWRKVGQGDDKLLLLHGFGPISELQWKDVVQELHHDFTMYIPDLIYFGESKSNYEKYDPGFTVRQLHQSIQNENIEEIYVAGISYGGLISSIYAHENPDEVKGLILIDALSKFSDNNHTDSLVSAYGYSSMNDILIPTDGKSLKTLLQISFYKPKRYPSWLLNRPAQILYSNQLVQKRGLLNYLSDIADKIKHLNFTYSGKVQIIWGQEDLLIPVSNAHELLKLYPNSNLTILPEVGHVANMENPTDVAKIILAMPFLLD